MKQFVLRLLGVDLKAERAKTLRQLGERLLKESVVCDTGAGHILTSEVQGDTLRCLADQLIQKGHVNVEAVWKFGQQQANTRRRERRAERVSGWQQKKGNRQDNKLSKPA